jgi:hypothetical protein
MTKVCNVAGSTTRIQGAAARVSAGTSIMEPTNCNPGSVVSVSPEPHGCAKGRKQISSMQDGATEAQGTSPSTDLEDIVAKLGAPEAGGDLRPLGPCHLLIHLCLPTM